MPSDADLLRQYCPVLQYDSHELYYCDSAATFTDNVFDGGPMRPYANVLRRKDGTVIAKAGDGLGLDFLKPDTYPDGQPVKADDFIDASSRQYVADARRLHADPALGNRAYGLVRPAAGGKRWLQYWFFYYFNDKSLVGFGIHEGDWEGIQIRVDAAGTPDAVTFAQHNGGQRAAWEEVEIEPLTRAPLVYVALGSHASYLRKGSHKAPVADDVCDAGGRQLRPELEIISDTEPAWVRWPGRWGASAKNGLISFPSPGSPRTQKRWRKPDDFHEDAREYRRDRAPAEVISRLPPVVTAARSADAIEVRIAGADITAKLVVTATVDGRPRAIEYDLNDLPEGAAAAPVRPQLRDLHTASEPA